MQEAEAAKEKKAAEREKRKQARFKLRLLKAEKKKLAEKIGRLYEFNEPECKTKNFSN